MYYYYMKKFNNFDIFLASNDLPMSLKEVEKQYLVPWKVINLHQKKGKKSITEVFRRLLIHKYKFKNNYIDA